MLHPCLVSWESFFGERPAITGLAEANLPATTKLKLAPVAYWKSKSIDVSTAFTLHRGVAVVFKVIPYGKIEQEEIEVPIPIQILEQGRVKVVGGNVIRSLQSEKILG